MTAVREYRFPRSSRLVKRREFLAVYMDGRRRRSGPLLIHAMPNGLGECRLGMAVPRRAGNAVVRNRIKRRCREAFRLFRDSWPAGYDVVIGVHRHEVLDVDAYARAIGDVLRSLHEQWPRKRRQPTQD